MSEVHEWLDAEDLEFLRECCYNDRPMVMRLLADLDAAKAALRECCAHLDARDNAMLVAYIQAIPGIVEAPPSRSARIAAALDGEEEQP